MHWSDPLLLARRSSRSAAEYRAGLMLSFSPARKGIMFASPLDQAGSFAETTMPRAEKIQRTGALGPVHAPRIGIGSPHHIGVDLARTNRAKPSTRKSRFVLLDPTSNVAAADWTVGVNLTEAWLNGSSMCKPSPPTKCKRPGNGVIDKARIETPRSGVQIRSAGVSPVGSSASMSPSDWARGSSANTRRR